MCLPTKNGPFICLTYYIFKFSWKNIITSSSHHHHLHLAGVCQHWYWPEFRKNRCSSAAGGALKLTKANGYIVPFNGEFPRQRSNFLTCVSSEQRNYHEFYLCIIVYICKNIYIYMYIISYRDMWNHIWLLCSIIDGDDTYKHRCNHMQS